MISLIISSVSSFAALAIFISAYFIGLTDTARILYFLFLGAAIGSLGYNHAKYAAPSLE